MNIKIRLYSIHANFIPDQCLQVLEVFPNPVTLTAVQLAVGTTIIFLTWALNLHKWPNISRTQVCHSYEEIDQIYFIFFYANLITCTQLVAILPLAVMHTLGNFSTNMSLGKVSVSFTHTIKAMEPFFTVILSTMFLGEVCFLSISLHFLLVINQ